MSGTKWEDDDAASYAAIGEDLASVNWSLFARDNSASVVVHDQHGDDHTLVERRASSRDAAKTVAEQALREMHDALVEHFAPVLRWDIDGTDARATVGVWLLCAGQQYWSISRLDRNGFADGARDHNNPAANRRLAEAALRSLGVVFRVEGES